MILSTIDPDDPIEVRYEKLVKIAGVLMRRVEQSTDHRSAAYAQFERAAMLEEEVGARTRELNRALDLLQESNVKLAAANDEAQKARADLAGAIETVNEGFALFDSSDALVMFNSRFAAATPDVQGALRPGLSFDAYVDRVSRSAHLSLPEGETPALWAQHRRARHKDEYVMFNVSLSGDRWIQVSEHRTAAGGTVILQTDVTDIMRMERRERDELREAVAAAERANATKSRFVAAASHDLLQPLSAAKLYLSALEADADAAPFCDVVRKAQNALLSVETILEALLDISRLDSGQSSFDVVDVSLEAVLRQLGDEFRPLAAQKGLQLRIVPSSAVIRSDPKYFRRILQNLIANAIKYTAYGKVLVGVRRTGPLLRVEVLDTGPGIAQEDQGAVFREFHRLNATASASAGMGLGLAIVERACAQLRHPLELRSVVGQGTRVAVAAPAARSRGSHSPEGPEGAGVLADALDQLAGKIVLLVEDKAELRRALTTLLESWGVTALEAAAADDALELIREIDLLPDALVVSAGRNRSGGALAALERLRAVCGAVPACLITSDRTLGFADECAAAGVSLIAKPIDPQVVQAALLDPADGPT